MPGPPAMIVEGVLECMRSVGVCTVTAVFLFSGYQAMGIVFIVIYLCGLEPHIIHAYFVGKELYVIHLVLIGFYHQELEDQERGFALQFFLPFYHVTCALQHFIQLAANAVLLVYLLCGTVYGNDQAVKATLNSFACIGIRKVVCIRRCSCIDAFIGGILDHVQE